MLSFETPFHSDASAMQTSFDFRLRRFTHFEDVPMDEARALLYEHAVMMHGRMVGGGGPDFDISEHIDAFWSSFDRYLPPHGSYYLAYNSSGAIIGTGSLKRVSHVTGEMKHLFVRPEARRKGLGEALVEARTRDAREMGLKELIADTFAANHEQPALYDKLGFERVESIAKSATNQISPELSEHMLFFRMSL